MIERTEGYVGASVSLQYVVRSGWGCKDRDSRSLGNRWIFLVVEVGKERFACVASSRARAEGVDETDLPQVEQEGSGNV